MSRSDLGGNVQSVRIFRVATAALLGVLLLTTVGAAKDGRDFAGFYSITNVTEQGANIQATLSLRLSNYTGDDLKEAVVVVRGSQPGSDVLSTFAPIAVWRNGTDTVVSQQVKIPHDEFERWGGRRRPNVVIVYRDSRGEWQRTAQINRRPMIPLEGSPAAQ
jgi:hypothetical protein